MIPFHIRVYNAICKETSLFTSGMNFLRISSKIFPFSGFSISNRHARKMPDAELIAYLTAEKHTPEC